jgi:catechol 2,3-dioxygenase-like lactoylglutathione lyase family enzyme
MDASHIDHVNLRIPADSVERAVAFYRDALGFGIDGLERYEAGEKSFFDVRLTPEAVLHLWPTDGFDPPERENYDHVAIVVDHPIAEIRDRLEAAGVPIERELTPLGATGEAPAAYVEDPFGYTVELKSAHPEPERTGAP